MNNYTYEQAVEYLLKIPFFAKKNSFNDTKDFLCELGRFENLKNVIHIAGTNGKGSVCSFVQSVLIHAGYNVGMFTSPHLVSINERICFNGIKIDNNSFVEAFNKVKECVDNRVQRGCTHPAFFEFIFGIALAAFEKSNLDYIILETGLGGRLDATNIIKEPLICAITSIGIDHTEYLGDTIEKIAAEKAGIIKSGVPVIFDADNKAVYNIIFSKADKENAKCIPVFEKNVKIKKIDKKYIDFFVEYGYDESICIKLKSNALYQMKNAQIAIEILNALNINLTSKVIKVGIENTVWLGRMQWIRKNFLIDGAHNQDGIDKAIDTVLTLDKQILLVFSAVSDKNYEKIIETICNRLPVAEVIVTELRSNRKVNAEELKKVFDIYLKDKVYIEPEVSSAIMLAERHLCKYADAIIFSVGSLYLVGEIIESMDNQ